MVAEAAKSGRFAKRAPNNIRLQAWSILIGMFECDVSAFKVEAVDEQQEGHATTRG